MRPIRLEIEGLRSFRDRRVIDFTGRSYIAIIGDTGAGKSSILEGLTFALYGRTTFSGHGHQELMNASSTLLRVVFRFDVGAQHWEIARTLRRAATGKVGTGLSSLKRYDDDDQVLESFEKARDVTAKVETILGLDDEAFLRTVVLPQGQFSRLLVDDDQKLRSSVLRQIWRTDELTEAGDLAATAVVELGPLLGRLSQARASEPDDPGAHLDGLEAVVKEHTDLLDAARHRHRRASDAAGALTGAAVRVERVGSLQMTLSKWDGAAITAAVAEIEAADRRVIELMTEAQRLLDDTRQKLEALPGDDDGFTIAEIASLSTRLQSLPGLATQREGAERAVVALRTELTALQRLLRIATSAVEQADLDVRELQSGRAGLADAAAASASDMQRAQAALDDARRDAEAVTDAEVNLDAARRSLAKLASALEGARAALLEASSSHGAATIALAAAQRSAAAAEAGHGLHPGDPCPVCDRDLPATWKLLEVPELEAARSAEQVAAAALDDAKGVVVRQQALVEAAERSVSKAGDHLAVARDQARVSHGVLVARVGGAPDLDRPDDELLAEVVSARNGAARDLELHDDLARRAREAHSAAGRAHAAARASHAAKATEITAALERSQAAAAMYDEQLGCLPEALRPSGDDIGHAITAPLATLEARHVVLTEREHERGRLHDDLERLLVRRQELERTQRTEVDEPIRRLWSTAIAHHSILERAAEDLGRTIGLPDVQTQPARPELARSIDLISRTTDELKTTAEAIIDAAQASINAAHGELSRLAAELDLDADEPDQIVTSAAATEQDITLDVRRAQEDADAFRRRMPAIARVRAAEAAVQERHLALSDLSAALRDGAFPKWLTLRRSRILLVHASRLLSQMTAGRYAFADLDDESSQWFVFDSDNGQPRSPSSLSGGEKFVASLALALGMVEMMGRQGDRIESLFLDEGFGALDRTNLDAAVEALASVSATGRMVAVITHLRAVAEQIDHVLSVTCEPTGTRAVWLSASGRSALAEGDIDAPGGLLE